MKRKYFTPIPSSFCRTRLPASIEIRPEVVLSQSCSWSECRSNQSVENAGVPFVKGAK